MTESDANRVREASDAAIAFRHSGDKVALAQALTKLGYIERRFKLHTAALLHYEEAAAIYRALGDTLRFAYTIRHVGDIHRDGGRTDLATPCFEEAVGLYRAHAGTPPLALANAIRGMALNKDSSGDAAGARLLWAEARELYSTQNVAEGVAECDRRLSRPQI